MKFILTFFLLLTFESLTAQKNGYYVTLNNDTIPAFIHLMLPAAPRSMP